MIMTSPCCSNKVSRSAKRATNCKHRVAVSNKQSRRLRLECSDDGTRSPSSSLLVSPDDRISMALQTLAHCNAVRLVLAQVELTLSKVVVVPKMDDFGVDREIVRSNIVPTPPETPSASTPHQHRCHQHCSPASTTLPVLSPAARALVSSAATNSTAVQRLGKENGADTATCTADDSNNVPTAAAAIQLATVLRRATITNPQTVQCMIDGLRQAQIALRELSPCRMSLEEFQSLVAHQHQHGCNHHSDREPPQDQQQQTKLLYLIVREALAQCEDLQDYYQTCPSFHAEQRFSARTLPPFVDGYDHEPLLNELSDRYWECEPQIQRWHRQSSQPISPGFTAEMVALLCHGYEIGREPSPIGLNLFQVDTGAVGE